MDYEAFEQEIRYRFTDRGLLSSAFTHSSFANEKSGSHPGCTDNERLEFLGDAVLELVVSDYLYKRYPKLSEGQLTKFRAKLVCAPSLVKHSERLMIGNYLRLGHGEEQNGGRKRESILSDAFEAVIGAVYLDGGIDEAKAFITRMIVPEAEKIQFSFQKHDAKTFLQEVLQKNSQKPIQYILIDEKGPDHDKLFTVRVVHEGIVLGEGTGKSKKEAEQNAATRALEKKQADPKALRKNG